MDAPSYNGLTQLEPTLPSSYYIDPAHHERELEAILYRDWLYLCRADALPDPAILQNVRHRQPAGPSGAGQRGNPARLPHTCRHRGSVLCPKAEGRLRSGLITCPYHSWSYDLEGALVRAPTLAEAVELDLGAHRLYDVAIAPVGRFRLRQPSRPGCAAVRALVRQGFRVARHWPLEDLVVGHVFEKTMACNWKVFWENFNECLHCRASIPSFPNWCRSTTAPS